jgi:hypothetical protein
MGPSVIFDLFPQPTSLGHRTQITEGPVLRPFSYTEELSKLGIVHNPCKSLIIFLCFWLQNENQIYQYGDFDNFFSSLLATENLKHHFIFLIWIFG